MSTLESVPPVTLSELVAEEVRALMARRRITGKQLAELLDLQESGVSARLNARIPFRVNELERIADVLGVHPATLFGGTPPLPPPPTTGRYSRKISTKRNVPPTSRVVVGTPRELAAVA